VRWLALLALVATGCIGSGDGWLAGNLWIEDCDEGTPLPRDTPFALDVDFFAGETLEDPNASLAQRRNRFALRIQVTSNNIEESDGLIFQFLDAEAAARAHVAGQGLPITNRVTCSGASCPPSEDLVRARLHLFTRCPACRQPLVGAADELGTVPGTSCRRPSGTVPPACPAVNAEGRAALDALCAGSFRDPSAATTIRTHLGAEGACLWLCEFGQARSAADLAGFAIRYGDRVAALYSIRIVDGRALETGGCAVAEGQIAGMVSFEVRRGQSAQAFP
jgi:hypothetical protein